MASPCVCSVSPKFIAGRDFEPRVLSLMFTLSGPTTLPASVAILEDEVVEAAENLLVVLSVPQGEGGVALVQNVSTVVIIDDDGKYTCNAHINIVSHKGTRLSEI